MWSPFKAREKSISSISKAYPLAQLSKITKVIEVLVTVMVRSVRAGVDVLVLSGVSRTDNGGVTPFLIVEATVPGMVMVVALKVKRSGGCFSLFEVD